MDMNMDEESQDRARVRDRNMEDDADLVVKKLELELDQGPSVLQHFLQLSTSEILSNENFMRTVSICLRW